MYQVKVSSKGQIVIPADIRRRFHLDQGTKVGMLEFGNEVILVPLPKDPIKMAKGMLHSKKSVVQMMKELRREELRLEKKKKKFIGGKKTIDELLDAVVERVGKARTEKLMKEVGINSSRPTKASKKQIDELIKKAS